MSKNNKVKSLALKLGLNYGGLSMEQQETLKDECTKQAFLATIHRQGFVSARWRGVPVKKGDAYDI